MSTFGTYKKFWIFVVSLDVAGHSFLRPTSLRNYNKVVPVSATKILPNNLYWPNKNVLSTFLDALLSVWWLVIVKTYLQLTQYMFCEQWNVDIAILYSVHWPGFVQQCSMTPNIPTRKYVEQRKNNVLILVQCVQYAIIGRPLLSPTQQSVVAVFW